MTSRCASRLLAVVARRVGRRRRRPRRRAPPLRSPRRSTGAAVAPDQPFVYRVTLSTAQRRWQPEGFKPPDFRGLRVLGGPFTQTGVNMMMGGGGPRSSSNVTWSYQLALPAGAKGSVTIGAAHVRVGGQELASNAVPVRVGARGARAARRSAPGLFPRGMFGDEPDEPRAAGVVRGERGVPPRRRRQAARLRGRAGDRHLVPVPRRAAEQLSAADAAQGRRLLVGGPPVDESRRDGWRSPTRSRAGSTTRSRWCCNGRCFRSRPAS